MVTPYKAVVVRVVFHRVVEHNVADRLQVNAPEVADRVVSINAAMAGNGRRDAKAGPGVAVRDVVDHEAGSADLNAIESILISDAILNRAADRKDTAQPVGGGDTVLDQARASCGNPDTAVVGGTKLFELETTAEIGTDPGAAPAADDAVTNRHIASRVGYIPHQDPVANAA